MSWPRRPVGLIRQTVNRVGRTIVRLVLRGQPECVKKDVKSFVGYFGNGKSTKEGQQERACPQRRKVERRKQGGWSHEERSVYEGCESERWRRIVWDRAI